MKNKKLASLFLSVITISSASSLVSAADADWEISSNTITKYNGTDKDVICPDEWDGNVITAIYPNAFAGKQINSVVLPKNLTAVYNDAFANCGLKSVKFPSTIKTIRSSAFSRNELTSLNLHGATTIESHAFYRNHLTSLQLSARANIGQYAFAGNEITSLSLPSGCTVGAAAFNDNLLPPEQAYIYSGGSTTVVSYGGAQRTGLTIPTGVTKIGQEAFAGCKLSESVTIPSTVTAIGDNAFKDNPDLRTICMEGRSDLSGMTLGSNWNGNAEIVFRSVEPPDPEPTPGETQADIAISGSISSATINIDVPLSTTFRIDENMEFSAPSIVIHNNSPVAIRVDGVSMKPANDTSPSIIDPDTYTDEEWQNLNSVQTKKEIALGLLTDNSKSDVRLDVVGGTRWFGKSNTGSNALYLGTIKPSTAELPSPKLTLDLKSKYGRVWGDTSKIDYTLCLSFSVE